MYIYIYRYIHIYPLFLRGTYYCGMLNNKKGPTNATNIYIGKKQRWHDHSLATNQDLATSLWFVTLGRRNASLRVSPSQFWPIGSHLSVPDLLTSSCTFWLFVHVRQSCRFLLHSKSHPTRDSPAKVQIAVGSKTCRLWMPCKEASPKPCWVVELKHQPLPRNETWPQGELGKKLS